GSSDVCSSDLAFDERLRTLGINGSTTRAVERSRLTRLAYSIVEVRLDALLLGGKLAGTIGELLERFVESRGTRAVELPDRIAQLLARFASRIHRLRARASLCHVCCLHLGERFVDRLERALGLGLCLIARGTLRSATLRAPIGTRLLALLRSLLPVEGRETAAQILRLASQLLLTPALLGRWLRVAPRLLGKLLLSLRELLQLAQSLLHLLGYGVLGELRLRFVLALLHVHLELE